MNKQVVRGAIVTKFGSQCVASKQLGINEQRLSRLLNGHNEMTAEEVKIFRDRLGVELSPAKESEALTV